jgi:hypothetical protein
MHPLSLGTCTAVAGEFFTLRTPRPAKCRFRDGAPNLGLSV